MNEFLFGLTVGLLICVPLLCFTLPPWINLMRAKRYLERELKKPMPEPVLDEQTKTVLEEANNIISSCSESKSQKEELTRSSPDSQPLTSKSKAN